ncbi:hypothetical protein T492DRAFT_256849, partial [Pavlovales sp. CCMP2436]
HSLQPVLCVCVCACLLISLRVCSLGLWSSRSAAGEVRAQDRHRGEHYDGVAADDHAGEELVQVDERDGAELKGKEVQVFGGRSLELEAKEHVQKTEHGHDEARNAEDWSAVIGSLLAGEVRRHRGPWGEDGSGSDEVEHDGEFDHELRRERAERAAADLVGLIGLGQAGIQQANLANL